MRRLSLKSTLFGVDPFWAQGGAGHGVKTRTALNGLCPVKPFAEWIGGEWAKKISHGFV